AFTTLTTLLLLICSNGLINAERVVCSYSSSAVKRPGEYSFQLSDIPLSLCTHVVYDHFDIDYYTYEFLAKDLEFDVWDNGLQKFADLKRNKTDLKLLISIRSPILLRVAGEAIARKTFIANVLSYVEWMKVDGVELFWSGSDEEVLYSLIEELRSSFVAAGHPSTEVNILAQIDQPVVDHARLCRLADYVHLLVTGERRPIYRGNSLTPTVNTTLDVGEHKNVSFERALDHYIEASCPAEKIVLTTLLIAQTYTLGNVENRDPPKELSTFCTLTKGMAFCVYMDMCQKFNESGWTFGWDDAEGLAPHARQGNVWVSYENEASVGRKGEIARSKQLAGVYVLSLELDDYRGKCGSGLFPLIKAISRSFRGTANDEAATHSN
uniref:GH18 domain-containing protein n=1 Tax=Anopheles maculatus TaxID=74869 RepID=A0A182SGC1_9DIPT